jgi:hypothetical protein
MKNLATAALLAVISFTASEGLAATTAFDTYTVTGVVTGVGGNVAVSPTFTIDTLGPFVHLEPPTKTVTLNGQSIAVGPSTLQSINGARCTVVTQRTTTTSTAAIGGKTSVSYTYTLTSASCTK